MDHSKKNVHNSGPLGMLVKSGQIKRIDNDSEPSFNQTVHDQSKSVNTYFRTQSGVEFTENELSYVDPKLCEPWKYANRLQDDMGDIDELMESIRENKQLQPALIRLHQNPHGDIKYEVIFGRRRHEACLRLGVKFLVIRKDIPNIQEAVAFQEAENRSRRDISNYSNAIHYKRLLEEGIFASEKKISEKLGMSLSRLYDIMAYAKIPRDIVKLIPDIHTLSNNFALKIVSILKDFPEKHSHLVEAAPEIGKTITSPAKLEKYLKSNMSNEKSNNIDKAKTYKSNDGEKLFIFKTNHRGAYCIEVNKRLNFFINYESLCEHLKTYLDSEFKKIESSV